MPIGSFDAENSESNGTNSIEAENDGEKNEKKRSQAPRNKGKKKQKLLNSLENSVCICTCGATNEPCMHNALLTETVRELSVPSSLFDDTAFFKILKSGPHSAETIQEHAEIFNTLLNGHKERINRAHSLLYGISDKNKIAQALCIIFEFTVDPQKRKEQRKQAFLLLEESKSTQNPELSAIINHYLGVCYLNGMGTDVDYAKAFSYFTEAVKLGNVDALCSLGVCYEKGFGVEKNTGQALNLYKNAAAQGTARGYASLATCYLGGIGIEQDFEEALRLNALASTRGDYRAQSNLGACAQFGQGFEVDPRLAFELYKISAEQGDHRAHYNLGHCFHEGIGCDRNIQAAIGHYQIAAQNGIAPAFYYLGQCFDLGSGVPRNPVEAVRYYKEAAKRNHASALADLGWCYETGHGIEKNIEAARLCYQKAVAQGSEAAAKRIQYLDKNPITPKFKFRKREFEVDFSYKSKGRSSLTIDEVSRNGLTNKEWSSILNFVIENEIGVLSLRSNNISRIPSNLGWEKAKLQAIFLDRNKIVDLPSDFAHQTKLLYLSLANNPLNENASNVIFAILTNSPELRQLFIGIGNDVNERVFQNATTISERHISALKQIVGFGRRTRASCIDFLNRGNFFEALEYSHLEEDEELRLSIKQNLPQPIYEEVLMHLLPLQGDKTESDEAMAAMLSQQLTRTVQTVEIPNPDPQRLGPS